MRRLSLLMCAAAITLAGFSVAMPVRAQDPLPRAFAHDVLPGGVEPSDGASAVVVEGLCGGLGGASYDWHIVAQDTATDINAHRPTITEISPQGPADCGGATLQDYEDMIADIYTNVESSTTEAATWWGGFVRRSLRASACSDRARRAWRPDTCPHKAAHLSRAHHSRNTARRGRRSLL